MVREEMAATCPARGAAPPSTILSLRRIQRRYAPQTRDGGSLADKQPGPGSAAHRNAIKGQKRVGLSPLRSALRPGRAASHRSNALLPFGG